MSAGYFSVCSDRDLDWDFPEEEIFQNQTLGQATFGWRVFVP